MAALWYAALLAVVVWMVIVDLRNREIPNLGAGLFTGLVLLALAVGIPDAERSIVWSLVVGALAFVFGLVLYGTGLLGGGDAKLVFGIAAVETWFGIDAWFIYLGVLISVGLVTAVWVLRADDAARSNGIPLGPMLLLGVVPSLIGAVQWAT